MNKTIPYEAPFILLFEIGSHDILTTSPSEEKEWKDENTMEDGWV